MLLKGYDPEGFVLFTNYGSRKGAEVAANPYASLLFPWFPMQRQVIVAGPVERLDRAETEAYFASRPRGSQLGAWASAQSSVLPDRAALDDAYRAAAERFADVDPIPARALGWAAGASRLGRVLAGPGQPAARPVAVPPYRRGLGRGAAGPVTVGSTDRPREQRRWAIDLRPLRVPAYRRLWLGNAIAMFGFQFTAVAVPVEMYALTEDSLWVGLLGVAAFVPLLVFGLWGGAVADAIDRRRVLLGGSVLLWVAVLGLLAQALLGVGSPILLLALVALSSVAFAISGRPGVRSWPGWYRPNWCRRPPR